MEVSTEISSGLKRLANNSLLSKDNMDKIINEISDYLKNPFNTQHSVGIPSTTPKVDILKESYAALLVFLVEAIRRNIDENELNRIITEYRIEESRKDKIINLFSEYKKPIQQSLKRFNSDPPYIINATWKMNYCVKSSFSDYDSKFFYVIEFTYQSNEEEKKISFVCSIQQLQTLVASLKSAVRQLESIANISK